MDNSEKSIRDIIKVLFSEERIKEGTKDLLLKYLNEMMQSTTWEEAFVKIMDRFDYKSVPMSTPDVRFRSVSHASYYIKRNGFEYEINVTRKQL